MNRVIIRSNNNAYSGACKYMHDKLGFQVLEISHKNGKSIKSGKEQIVDGFRSIKGILRYQPELKNADILISIGNISNIWLLLLNKLHIIKTKVLLWWGFFIHRKKVQSILKIVLKALNSNNIKYLLFSECETAMYQQTIGISAKSMVYIPYGDWENLPTSYNSEEHGGDYFFGGGYSNRDYRSLLTGWNRYLPNERLILIGSKNNPDLVEFSNSYKGDKIKVLFDTPSHVFDEYLICSKACILPFKENTGASGQSVMLRCMRLNKIVISTDTDIMKEYVDNGSAFMIQNYDKDLLNAVELVNNNPKLCEEMLIRQQKLYLTKFSFMEISKRLKEIVKMIDT